MRELDERANLRITKLERIQWEKEARKHGLSLSEFVRDVVNYNVPYNETETMYDYLKGD